MLVDRIVELESEVRSIQEEKQALEQRLGLMETSSQGYRNEINFLNGKCSTLKRDLEYSERYIEKFKQENTKIGTENDYLKAKIDQMDRESALLQKQVSGLHEDNDRINRLYQVVENQAFTTSLYKKQEVGSKSSSDKMTVHSVGPFKPSENRKQEE